MVTRSLTRLIKFIRPITLVINKTQLNPTLVGECKCSARPIFASAQRNLASKGNNSDVNSKDENAFDRQKADIILKLNFKSPEDGVPFYKLPTKSLLHVLHATNKDIQMGHCTNRLYYLADKLQCKPSVLSEKLVRRIFLYELSFDWIKSSLDVLLEMGVPPERLVRDLWVIRYSSEHIRGRLQLARDAGLTELYPWMVRCQPHILDRSIDLWRESVHIFGQSGSRERYLARRLNVSEAAVRKSVERIPSIRTIRPAKLRSFLDFLLSEGYTEEDIASRPRVLASSQSTVSVRLERLRELGLQKPNLNVLCRSRKNFRKYCAAVEGTTKDVKQER